MLRRSRRRKIRSSNAHRPKGDERGCDTAGAQMKVAVLSPTTSQLIEKMGALFPEGVDLIGPQADDRHYWNNCHLRLDSWKALGLQITIKEQPFEALDFKDYDLLIESAEA